MEFIKYKTLNQLELNEDNCNKIKTALNSYISSSLYAMFNGLPIVFHGDPHNGNIYIDESGNIGFLDMGLLFELSEEDKNGNSSSYTYFIRRRCQINKRFLFCSLY